VPSGKRVPRSLLTDLQHRRSTTSIVTYGMSSHHYWLHRSRYFVLFMAAIDLLTETFCQNSWIAQLFFLLSTCSIKVSILLFYRRLDAGTHSWFFSCAFLAAIGAIVAYALAFVLILIFQCRPLDSYWLRFAPNYTGIYNCTVNEPISLPISAYLSVVTDFLALLLPFWLVWNMKLPRRQKWSLYAVFGLGLV